MPSILALMRAIRGSVLPPTDRHILMTLVSLADPDTGIIPERFQPSFTDLAHFTGLGRSTVGRRLPFIEEAGWIKRTAPSAAAAWRDKEKNSYVVQIPVSAIPEQRSDDVDSDPPTSPIAGLVPEGDQSEGQSQSGTSPTAGLGLVPEGDRTSPTAGLEVPDLRTKRTTTAPTERRAHRATDLFGAEEPEPPVTTQTILGDFIDYCTSQNVKIPKRLKGQYSTEIKSALDDGFTPKQIKNCLAGMLADNVINHPSWLSNRLVAMQTGPEKPRDDRQPRSGQRGGLGSTRHRVQDSHADVERYKEKI